MRKIPTLFEREFENHKVVAIKPIVTPGLEWVLRGEGIATVKVDGACCAIIDGVFYKRYDAKRGKTPPAGAIPCQPEPDPITGHWPHWVKVDPEKPEDRWFVNAYVNTYKPNRFYESYVLKLGIDGTYEAIGPHFQGNPYRAPLDFLVKHGENDIRNCPRDFDGLREFLLANYIEGIVFWKDGEPQCKIKRSDFGFSWPVNK